MRGSKTHEIGTRISDCSNFIEEGVGRWGPWGAGGIGLHKKLKLYLKATVETDRQKTRKM